MVECREYLDKYPMLMDDRARNCLLGARPLVMECVLQQSRQHVVRWAEKEPKMALVGLVRNLELTYQIYGERISYPRGLVPFLACARSQLLCFFRWTPAAGIRQNSSIPSRLHFRSFESIITRRID